MKQPKIEVVPIQKLIPYASNSRTHSEDQIAEIAGSIREFGFTNPVLIGNDDTIYAGHGRVMAARKLGMESVPCIRLGHLTSIQAKAYVIADNKLALNAGWDEKTLKAELELLKTEDFNIDLLGFSDEELNLLLNNEKVEGNTDPDEIPEPPVEPVTKTGDLWILGNHKLLCGDSTSIDSVQNLMNGSKADMIFTDPPYGVSYEGGHNTKKRQQIKNDALDGENLTGLFYGALSVAVTVAQDHAAFYVWYAERKSIETFRAFHDLPLKLRAIIQWYKVESGLGAFMAQYIPNCEPCIYAFKSGCSPQWFGPTNEKTVWELKKETRNNFHPTQKPVELSERAITNSSKQGQIVLDLFGGSGSTLIGCERTGRHARLMELDPKYCDVIVKRWEDFTGKKAVLESVKQ